MTRYIDADAFDERIRISVGLVEEELTDDYKDGVRCTLEMLKTQPTADVVEVVRCKDCKDAKYTEYAPPECKWYCKNSTNYHDGSFFCSMGERREECKEW